MNYLSTRNRDLRMNAPQAIAKGLAPDGGLLTPAVLPRLPASLSWEKAVDTWQARQAPCLLSDTRVTVRGRSVMVFVAK